MPQLMLKLQEVVHKPVGDVDPTNQMFLGNATAKG